MMATTSLQWKHQELNRLFAQLPDFAGALLVCANNDHWQKIASSLRALPIQSSGPLSFHLVDEEDVISCPQDADVLIVIRKEIGSSEASQLDATEAAVICICSELPKEQSSCFDLLVTFSENSVTSSVRSSQGTTTHEFSFKQWARPDEKKIEPSGPLLGFWGFSDDDVKAFCHDLPGVQGSFGKDVGNRSARLAVVKGGFPDEATKHDIELAARTGPVMYLPQRDLRKDDRLALYRIGVQAILPVHNTHSETVAAIRPWLGSAAPTASGGADSLDAELLSLQVHMRRNQYFSSDQEPEMVQALHLLVANRIKKARATREACASLLIKVPKSFDENTRHRLTVLVSGVVRQQDLVFSCCQAIVVVSNDVNKMTARAMLRRLKLSADPKWLSGCQANILEARNDPAVPAEDAADAFLRTIFAAADT